MRTNNQTQPNDQHKGADKRSDTRKHKYKDHDEVLTNDENYDSNQKFKGDDADFDNKLDNEEKKK